MSEQSLAEQQADRVVSAVRKAGIRDDILEVLQRAIETNVREASVQSNLVCIGQAALERDRAWVQQLQGEWTPKSGLKTATTPAEVEKEIRIWFNARISEARDVAYKAGYGDSYPVGIQEGVKLGWGAGSAGKSLEATLKAARDKKPSF